MAGRTGNRADRIARLVGWAEAKGSDGPDIDDVRIVAALGIDRLEPLAELLCIRRDALRSNWSELQQMLAAAPSTAGPTTTIEVGPVEISGFAAAPLYSTAYPLTSLEPSLNASDGLPNPARPPADSSLVGPALTMSGEDGPARGEGEARHARLLAWRSRAALDRPEVGAISDEDLRRLAFSEAETPNDVTQFSLRTATRSLFNALAGQLAEALGSASPARIGESQEGVLVEAVDAPDPEPEAAEPHLTAQEAAAPASLQPPGYFAPFNWGAVAAGPPDVPAMLVVPEDDGVRLAWEPVQGPAKVIYRVVEAVDTWANVAPDTGVTIGATAAHEVTAPISARGAATYLTVWANEGDTEIAARNAQPRLVARGEIVWPPLSLSVSVTPTGEVVARFKAPPAAIVEVQKFAGGEPVRYDQAKTMREGVSEDGFLDRQAQPGIDLTYAVYTVAVLTNGEKVVSDPKTAMVKVVPDPHSVSLKVEASPATARTYDISWVAPPFGTVEVFLTSQQPPSGLGDQSRTLEVIEMQGLTQERQLKYPVQRSGNTHRMVGVTLDPSWVKGFFVAVHVVSNEAVRVGPMQSTVNARPPKEPRIVERVDTEVITFQWPDDVRMIEVFQGPLSEVTLDPAQADVIATLTEDEYVERGGLRLKQPLPSNGCALYLFGLVYDLGAPTRSAPVRVEYKGITRLRYRVEPARRDGMPIGHETPPDFYRVMLQTDEPMPPTPLCLVSNATRLPLHPQDTDQEGLPVMTWGDVSPTPGAPVTLCEIPAGRRRLYVRLFLNYPPAQCGSVAVLDPPLSQLRVLA